MSAVLKSKPHRVMLRVVKGALQPADSFSAQELRRRGYHIGDIVAGEIKKPRNPGFHRLAHALGGVVADNIDAFSGMDAHAVLKRLQIEANIGCDEIALNFPGVGPCTYRVPQSLSYESMDEGQFREVIGGMCAYISRRYWPEMDPGKIEAMADLWIEATA